MDSKVNVKLTDAQIKKLKTTVKDKTGTTLRMSLKMVDGNDLPHELFFFLIYSLFIVDRFTIEHIHI